MFCRALHKAPEHKIYMLSHSVERIHPSQHRSREKYLLFLRHVFAYEYVIEQIDSEARVLEIGSGEGYGTRMLGAHCADVVAVDTKDDAVQHARSRHAGARCTFEHYDGARLPFPDSSFDAVVSMQVIEHVEDDRRFVKEARRVLKPHGTLWLTTPNRTHRIPEGGEVWNPFHVREYSPGEFAALLQSVFSGVRVGGIRGTPEIDSIEHRRVRRGFTPRKMIPEFVKGWMGGAARRRYTTADFHVDWSEAGRNGLDLIACCTRRDHV